MLGIDFQKQPGAGGLGSCSSDLQWCVEPLARRRMELAAVLGARTMVTFNDRGQGGKLSCLLK